MNLLATFLFPIGTVAIAVAFAAHVGHAVLLANGRRSIGLALGGRVAQPAWAGAVTGSFADARSAALPSGSADAPLGIAPTPLGRAAAGLAGLGFASGVQTHNQNSTPEACVPIKNHDQRIS